MRKTLLPILFLFTLMACTGTFRETQKRTTAPALISGYSAYVVKPKINLRSRPSGRATVVAVLEDGNEVRIIKNNNGWLKVQDLDGHSGYVRSDLIGPRNLSRARLAAAFNDSIMPRFNAELFLDKTATYKIVYLTLPEKYYTTKAKARKQAKMIGRAYQQQVYPGAVEIRILKPKSKDLFERIKLSAKGYAGNKLPVLPFGRIIKWRQKNYGIRIWVAIPANIGHKKLLKTARKISATYDLPVNKTEIYFVLDEPDVVRNVRKRETNLRRAEACILYYLEDKNGEDYHFNFCAPK